MFGTSLCARQAFCTANGYLQSRHLTAFHRYDESWLRDWRFVLGCACFLLGLALNVHSDAILRNLRRPGETGYKIPRGGWVVVEEQEESRW